MYGGYFGAAQGVLLMAILGLTYGDRLQVLNGVKNVLACVVNAIAAVVFIIVGAFGLGGSEHPSVQWGAGPGDRRRRGGRRADRRERGTPAAAEGAQRADHRRGAGRDRVDGALKARAGNA